ncbi:MAG: hypothetical protein PHY34_01225 [Patescibacteria group bacterium]|nr:hypothetical protein [Patescibacteria group bacterium]MDD5715160.1 hypothetical protein [Patescibacteria group bacterium]
METTIPGYWPYLANGINFVVLSLIFGLLSFNKAGLRWWGSRNDTFVGYFFAVVFILYHYTFLPVQNVQLFSEWYARYRGADSFLDFLVYNFVLRTFLLAVFGWLYLIMCTLVLNWGFHFVPRIWKICPPFAIVFYGLAISATILLWKGTFWVIRISG